MNTDAKDVIREGYDRVSHAYRGDAFPYEQSNYKLWVDRLLPLLPANARILDLGCGCGVPVTQELALSHRVTGVDFSAVQIERARWLVPEAEFVCADMAAYPIEPDAWDGVVALFSLIHVPLDEQPRLLAEIARGLRPGGVFLATVGHRAWIGTEENWRGVEGVTMAWSHADIETYRRWFDDVGLERIWEGFKPEDDGGHGVLLARRPASRGDGSAIARRGTRPHESAERGD